MLPGEDAAGVFPAGDTASYAGALAAIVPYDPDAEPVMLIDTSPYDPVAAAEVPVGFSRGASTPVFDGRLWRARIAELPTWEIAAQLEERGIGGGSLPSFGALKLAIGDGSLDTEFGYYWDGRTFRLLTGTESMTFPQFTQRLSGIIEDVEWDPDMATVHLRSEQQQLLDQPVQQNLYAGTGGREGESGLEGQPKPLAYGRVLYAQPVLLDGANQVYQLNDGPISASLLTVFDGGLLLTSAGAVVDVYAWSPVGGSYVYETATGIIRLGAIPVYALSARFITAERTIAAAVKAIVTRHGVLTTGQLDLASFDALDVEFPDGFPNYLANGPNLYLTRERTIADWLDEILQGMGAYWTFTHGGQLRLGTLKIGVSAGTLDANILTIQRGRTLAPVHRIIARHSRTWRVHGPSEFPSEFAGSSAFTSEWRSSTTDLAGVEAAHVLSRILTLDTPFVSGGELIPPWGDQGEKIVRNNVATLLGTQRHRYNVTVTGRMFQILPGDTWTLKHDRWGLSGGKDMLVLGVKENLGPGTTTLRLFG